MNYQFKGQFIFQMTHIYVMHVFCCRTQSVTRKEFKLQVILHLLGERTNQILSESLTKKEDTHQKSCLDSQCFVNLEPTATLPSANCWIGKSDSNNGWLCCYLQNIGPTLQPQNQHPFLHTGERLHVRVPFTLARH